MIETERKGCVKLFGSGTGNCLVPVIAPGVNDMQVGDILKFAMDHMLLVRGVHFSRSAILADVLSSVHKLRITIPKMLKDRGTD